ncbi:hypothetical protein [Sandaracinus amylolyticus]|uniref:hypothetical protein n=1 Tax=Sandaracinus amylolyticus TaxID=927083 RepID=UPI001F1A4CF6|nr:hypothetical protein [Sandaracinus amylolyticus]UJR79851.1 Hypothetical protein I5071_18900 [Sandaracinus amylolyticus]
MRIELWKCSDGRHEVAITNQHSRPCYVVEARRIRHADALEALDIGSMHRRIYDGAHASALITPDGWLRRAYRVLAQNEAA